MLCRDFMPRTNDAALEQRESGLDAVRGNVAVNVDLRAVVDALVLVSADSRLSALHRDRLSSRPS